MRDSRFRPELRRLPGLLFVVLTAAAMAAEEPAPPPPSTVVMVPMRDGVRLATEIYLPDGGGPCPVVLARSVYGRGFGPQWGPAWLEKGIAFAVQDCRGRGDSEGTDMGFFADGWGEARDGADTVAWLRAQPW